MTDRETTVSDIRIVSKNATPEEIAAVTAVLTASLEELADAQTASPEIPSQWMLGRRALRGTLAPGPGAWRHG
ncbi:hypothetical protein M2152_001922 [Microbacteriaceae bacterium SG_E_30_P1]|uniref:Acyl-CoA carboxylase epsilon subunit-like protein n=1 Tax=Antiquaquibacter oligotrophicus TaxID=2880260 RepID=A0ABT6KP18_9MICO|nr:acyl-CoA carboxylase subunit epsilon [Antiquaquibacter oligotrophicus]MDH6181740.1 hypothetical protein [Antiquaquibacter oligotrophicus]UDF12579.1 acyl-CoA carboxylase subunit epsilon [Antiquaquibacter oligotrophicus]